MSRDDFLTWLYEHCEGGQVETRALPTTKKQAFHDLGDWQSVSKWCMKYAHDNLYLSVATRNGGGTKDHIVEIPSVWADIDFKDYPDKDTAKRTIYEFPLRPSVMLETGGGYHAYWRFKEPATKDEIPEIEKILKALADHLGADQSVTDASHILRLPETINHKYENKPAVKVVWDNRELEYNPHDFDDPLSLYKLERVRVQTPLLTAKKHDLESQVRDTAGQNGTLRDITPPVNFSTGHHDNTLFKIAWHLAKGFMPEEQTQQVIEYIAETLDPKNETKKWAREKTRSAYTRMHRKDRNLSEEIRDWVRDTCGTFCGTEVDKDLEIGTKRDKENRKKTLQRLLAKGILERVGGKNNLYRKIEHECDEIDFLTAPTDEINLTLPLGLSDHFKIYPKNIIVFAGEPDAGKTALMLNIIKDNMHQHEIHYFSSEMGNSELRTRLELFSHPPLQDWNFTPYERSANFSDVIRPDAINIIDYLEISDTFYQIGGMIGDIHHKLNNGIAICALQKSPDKDFGRGGTFSLEKPRLYISISNDYPGHTAKITKCKNWRNPLKNPIGLTKHFKLVKGYSIVESTKWRLKTNE
jgi:hypothetical protein